MVLIDDETGETLEGEIDPFLAEILAGGEPRPIHAYREGRRWIYVLPGEIALHQQHRIEVRCVRLERAPEAIDPDELAAARAALLEEKKT